MPPLYCYHLNPIDNWTLALSPSDAVRQLAMPSGPFLTDPARLTNDLLTLAASLAELSVLVENAQSEFLHLGWEGKFRKGQEHAFFCVPSETDMRIGYMLKQENNGQTFVASPVAMPWLETIAEETSVRQV